MYTRRLCALMTGLLVAGPALAEQDKASEPPPEAQPNLECRVVLLKHAECGLIAKHVRALFEQKDAVRKVTWYEPANAVLMRASPDELKQMEYLIDQLDVAIPKAEPPPPPSRSTRIIPIKHAKADVLASIVPRVVASCSCTRGRRSCQHFKAYSDKRTNTLMVQATDDEFVRTTELINVLDVAVEHPRPVAD